MDSSATTEPASFGFGYVPTPDEEYNRFPRLIVDTMPTPYPSSVDLSSKMTGVKSQGWHSCCVGFAVCAALETIPIITSQEHPNESGEQEQNESDAFVWYNAKLRDNLGNPMLDRGTLIPAAIAGVQSVGSVWEHAWPYENAMKSPGIDIIAMAGDMQVHPDIGAYPLPGNKIDDYKKVLCQGFPVVVGFDIFGDGQYLIRAIRNKGVMEMPPTPLPGKTSGHAVLFVGYNDDTQQIKFKNSWGPNSGDNGYFYMPYEYLQWTRDAWVIQSQESPIHHPSPSIGFASPLNLQPKDIYFLK